MQLFPPHTTHCTEGYAQARSIAHIYGAASPEEGYFNHVYSSFRLRLFPKYKLHFVSFPDFSMLGFLGRDLAIQPMRKRGALRSIGMRNRSSAEAISKS